VPSAGVEQPFGLPLSCQRLEAQILSVSLQALRTRGTNTLWLVHSAVAPECPADSRQTTSQSHDADAMTSPPHELAGPASERVVFLAQPEPFRTELTRFREEIEAADWYALSARRADRLLRDKLFDRVYAVRVRAFARNYRNAELDMHFSLTKDLTPLKTFLASAKERGLHGLAVDLERGEI